MHDIEGNNRYEPDEPIRYLWKESITGMIVGVLLFFPFLRTEYDLRRFVVRNVQHSSQGVSYEVSHNLQGPETIRGYIDYGKNRECLHDLKDGDILTIYKSKKQSLGEAAIDKLTKLQVMEGNGLLKDYDLEARVDKED
jgi:hypothetical protein